MPSAVEQNAMIRVQEFQTARNYIQIRLEVPRSVANKIAVRLTTEETQDFVKANGPFDDCIRYAKRLYDVSLKMKIAEHVDSLVARRKAAQDVERGESISEEDEDGFTIS